MSPTVTPRAAGRLLAGGMLWCAGWAAVAASALLPALSGSAQAIPWALTTSAAGMSLLVLAPAGRLSIVRPVVLAAPASAAAAWVPALLSMPLWLVTAAAVAGAWWCGVLAARLFRGVRAGGSC